MRSTAARARRSGAILPLVVLSTFGLMALLALAIDVGMIAMARTQAQHIADAAAMTAARSLSGGTNANLTQALTNAQSIAQKNTVLSDTVYAADVTVQFGAYHYDAARQTFLPQYPPGASDNYNLATATVVHDHPSAFAAALGTTSLNVTAVSTAAHRPRDVAVVLDYSGSMNNESDLWNAESYLGTFNNTSNNSDPIYPQFGPYDTTFSPRAALQQTSSDTRVGKCNVTQSVLGVPAMAGDYFQSSRGATLVSAFSPAPAAVTVTNPGGDNYLPIKNGTNAARTWAEITGSALTAFAGYPSFKGYTQGPGYWGMTFYIWPPDPTPAKDWRKKYFLKTGGSYPNFGGAMNDNTKLWDSSGAWLGDPSSNYVINYKAILTWINTNCVQATAGDGKPFPSKLRAGHVLFYDYIPADLPQAAYDHTQINASITWADQSQRFWKEYIDYTIGVWRDPYGNIQNPPKPACSMGGDFTAGSSTAGQGVFISGPDLPDPAGHSYVGANDNPKRPRHRFWFGPMTMIQFMSDTGLLPGTAQDISLSVAKLGVNGALLDIQNNHPNDLVSMILFNRPQYSNDPAGTGAFNNVQYALSRDYAGMINSLWFPPNSSVNDVRPWDANGLQTPRAHSDYNANTATSYGFMLAYNQMSSNSTLAGILSNGQVVGGLGRKGAQRIVILETDGMANETSIDVRGFSNGGANNSYYHILPGDTVNGASFDSNDLYQVVQAICNKADGTPGTSPGYSPNPAYPGYATSTKPVLIHTLAFGAVFEPNASGSEATAAVALLQQISSIGGTVFPGSSSDATNGYKWIIGTLDQRKAKLKQAFSTVMDNGLTVSLVK